MDLNAFYDIFQDNTELLLELLMLLQTVALYVLSRIGLFLLARRRELSGTWTVWMPIGDQITLWRLSDQYQRRLTGQIKYRRTPVIITEAVFIVVNWCSVIWVAIFVALLALVGLYALGMAMINVALLMFGGLDAADHLLGVEGAGTSAMDSPGLVMFLSMGELSLIALLVITVIRTVINSRLMMDVYRSSRRKFPGALLVLGILFPFLKPVFLFLCAKNEMKKKALT